MFSIRWKIRLLLLLYALLINFDMVSAQVYENLDSAHFSNKTSILVSSSAYTNSDASTNLPRTSKPEQSISFGSSKTAGEAITGQLQESSSAISTDLEMSSNLVFPTSTILGSLKTGIIRSSTLSKAINNNGQPSLTASSVVAQSNSSPISSTDLPAES